MEYHPEPIQVLLLWKLATNNGAAWKADIKPAHITDKSKRDALVHYGLISAETRKREAPGKRATRGLFITLEEKGWAWLADHLDAPISRSAAAADVLQSILGMLQHHLDKRRLVLADFIEIIEQDAMDRVAPIASEAAAAPTATVVESRIVAAYKSLADQQTNQRIRLSDLRRELSDLSREQVDRALHKMANDGVIVLNRLDNPLEITRGDEAASLVSPLGDPRHIMHMEIPAHV